MVLGPTFKLVVLRPPTVTLDALVRPRYTVQLPALQSKPWVVATVIFPAEETSKFVKFRRLVPAVVPEIISSHPEPTLMAVSAPAPGLAKVAMFIPFTAVAAPLRLIFIPLVIPPAKAPEFDIWMAFVMTFPSSALSMRMAASVVPGVLLLPLTTLRMF